MVAKFGGKAKNKILNTIAKNQEKAVRTISFKDRTDPVAPLFKSLNILPLYDQIKFNNLSLTYDFLSENCPPILDNCLIKLHDLHSHGTRSARSNKLLLPQIRKPINNIRLIVDWNSNPCLNLIVMTS